VFLTSISLALSALSYFPRELPGPLDRAITFRAFGAYGSGITVLITLSKELPIGIRVPPVALMRQVCSYRSRC